MAAVVLALLLGGAARAGAQIVVLELPRERVAPHVAQPLLLEEHRLESTIRDGVATTRIDQKYRNPNGWLTEGVFLFPVPRDTHVERLAIDVNGEMREAELLDADKARRIYEEIVRRRRCSSMPGRTCSACASSRSRRTPKSASRSPSRRF